ncbi:MAG TPA: universal stress protein [bacterium]|nr:universal stress protein [bacterium]
MMRILLATDGSPHALRAAAFTARLTREALEVELTVVNVGHVPSVAFGGPGAGAMVDFGMLEEGLERAGREILNATVHELAGVDAPIVKEYRRGDPTTQILEAAKAKQADLIVIGCRGLSQLGSLLLGSVSERVLHGAHTPVLIVR